MLVRICLAATAVAVSLGAMTTGAPKGKGAPPVSRWRGVNDAGAEFGVGETFSNAHPGTYDRQYHYSGLKTLRYFRSRGFNMVRLPVRWERLQPRLGEALDAAELSRLRHYLWRAREAGMGVAVEPHNFGRYHLQEGDRVVKAVIDGHPQVTRARFADFWRRVATALRDEPALWAYDLVNEPHDLGRSDWKAISQAAVDGIRSVDRKRLILLPGDGWSNAEWWPKTHGPRAWIHDPAGRVAYEAHLYLDRDYSGRYRRSYDEELQADAALPQRGRQRLQPFIAWCRANRVPGFLGEFGVPDDDPRWLPALQDEVRAAQEGGLGWCYWAAGEWWGKSRLAIQPREGADRPQLKALLPFLRPPRP